MDKWRLVFEQKIFLATSPSKGRLLNKHLTEEAWMIKALINLRKFFKEPTKVFLHMIVMNITALICLLF